MRYCCLILFGTLCTRPAPAQHVVHVTPSTVEWGYFAADAKPVLTVKSGEVVAIDTICGIPEMLERLGATADGPMREMKEMYAKVKDRGPGPTMRWHALARVKRLTRSRYLERSKA
jgi:hypothetical protein